MKTGNPFKFLDSFTKEDKSVFFGRDKEVEEIYSRVFQSNLLLVYGASGTGKTSLIQCGLANKFNDSDWLPVLIRRGGNMMASIRTQLEHLAITPLKENSSFKKSIQSLYLDHFKPLYLIFDQFEELFIFGSSDEIKTFVTEMSRIVKSDLQCKFIFVIRGEYLEHLTVFEEELPEFFNNRIRIEKMTRHNAAEAITGPCRMSGIEIEPGFEQQVLETLSPGKAEVELTYLQVFLDKLYKKASQKNPDHPVFSIDLLNQTGKISDVLSDFLEEQVAKIPDSEAALAVLKSFVSMEGTKRQIDTAEITKFVKTLGKDLTVSQVDLFVHQFVDLRILRDKDEGGKYELRHDSLAIKIYEKITIVEKELIEVRSLIESAFANYQKRGILINENDLAYIAPYERKLFLNENLHAFVDTSRKAASQKKRRRFVVLISTAGFLIVLLSGFTIWALSERSQAMIQSHEAEKQKLLAENEMKKALLAKDEAQKADISAEIAKTEAERHEKTAITAKQQAEAARQQAFIAMGQAEREKANAMVQSERAKTAAANAETQKEIAKTEKQKAEVSEQKARQSYLLSLAQSAALKSPMYKNDPQLMALLACQAYQMNAESKGPEQDPVIYEALRAASVVLNMNPPQSFDYEPKAFYERNDSLYTASTGEITVVGAVFSRGGMVSGSFLDKPGAISGIPPIQSYPSPIDQIVFGPDGRLVLTSHNDFTLCLWNLKERNGSSAAYQELRGHKGLIRGTAFNADASRLATGGKDSLILFWKIENGKIAIEKTAKANAAVKALLFSKDGHSLYSLQEDGGILIWDLNTFQSTPLAVKAKSRILCFGLDKVRNLLVAGLSSGNLDVIDLNMHTEMEINAHTAGAELLIFNKDFSLMATAGSDKTIRIFNCQSLDASPVTIKDLNSKVRHMLFAGDNRIIASCSDKNVHLLETSSAKLAAELSQALKRNITKVEWVKTFKDLPYQKTRKDLPE
jgi:hypothetical protein